MIPIASCSAADIRKQVDSGDAKPERAGSAPRQVDRRVVGKALKHHRPARAEIHPPGNLPAFAVGRHDIERSVAGHRNRRKAAGSQNLIMCNQQIADRAHAIAQDKRRIFSRGVEHFIIEQKNPVFVSGDDRLDQYRIVVPRNVVEIPGKRGFVMHGLREVAARSRQRLDECRSAQFSEIAQRVLALMAGRAMGAMPVMQKEIFAAQRRHASLFQDRIGEILVGRQRRSGGVVLRIV